MSSLRTRPSFITDVQEEPVSTTSEIWARFTPLTDAEEAESSRAMTQRFRSERMALEDEWYYERTGRSLLSPLELPIGTLIRRSVETSIGRVLEPTPQTLYDAVSLGYKHAVVDLLENYYWDYSVLREARDLAQDTYTDIYDLINPRVRPYLTTQARRISEQRAARRSPGIAPRSETFRRENQRRQEELRQLSRENAMRRARGLEALPSPPREPFPRRPLYDPTRSAAQRRLSPAAERAREVRLRSERRIAEEEGRIY